MNLSEKSIYKISTRMFEWGFDIWEQNRSSWTKKQLVEFEATWKMLKRMVKQHAKQQEALDMVEAWLNSNMDEPPPEGVQEDSANLLEKIKEITE
jgi:hypothetical protein